MTEFLFRSYCFLQRVRIQSWKSPRPLVFVDCHFGHGFFAHGAKIDCDITFVGCTFDPPTECAGNEDVALDFSNAHVDGDLVFFDCKINGRFLAQRLQATGNVWLQGCRIAPAKNVGRRIKAGEVLADNIENLLKRLGWPVAAKEGYVSLVSFDRSVISGHFEVFSAGRDEARRVNADEPSASIDNDASIIAGHVSCVGIEVEGNITLADTIIFGRAIFDGSKITGNFILKRALLRGAGDKTDFRLSLSQATVGRNVDFSCAEIEGSVSLYGLVVKGFCRFVGLFCAGDLDLNFATSTYLAAYRDYHNSATLNGRKVLHIGRDLLLSGARIGAVELRAAKVGRDLKAHTGEFGTFTLGLGIEPMGNGFWPVRCLVRAVSLTSVHVHETLDVGGILVGEDYLKQDQDKRYGRASDESTTRFPTDLYGLQLLNCEIDGALLFFPGERLEERLRRRWDSDFVQWDPPRVASGESMLSPNASAFPSKIAGDLVVRACRIGGDLDLRNLHAQNPRAQRGGIFLNNCSVGLNLKAGSRRNEPIRIVDDLEILCSYLNGEKLSCQNDVDLSGIRVEKTETIEKESEVRDDQKSNVTFCGAQIGGDLLFAPLGDWKKNSALDATASGIAQISGELDLTAVRCEKLALSGRSFVSDPKSKFHDGGDRPVGNSDSPRAILARGHFSQVEILDWPPSQNWSAVWAGWKQCLREILPRLGHLLVRLIRCPFTFLKSMARGLWQSISRRITSTSQPINLRQIAVDKWILGDGNEQESERARHYATVLREMDPEDRSTWLKVESDLRSKSYEWQADRVYLAMAWSSMRRRRKRWFFWRPLVFLWHLVVCLAQTCFLWTKAFFVVPLAITCMTLLGLSYLFMDSLNVRATIGYLHAIPAEIRMQMPEPNEIHPEELYAEWKITDAIALALRYHIPLFESRTHDRWEASENKVDLGTIGKVRLVSRMETIAFVIEVIYWIALPILLLGFAAWAFRKRDAD